MEHGGGEGGEGQSNSCNHAEAERLLSVAEKLLSSWDLSGSRDFAILAQETEPLLDGSDQILAVADVLLASEKRVGNKRQHDWYAVLQIDSRDAASDNDLIKRQYRRLALLLHPDKNRYPFADQAFRLVSDAWVVLSDPTRKRAYDSEIGDIFTRVDLNKNAKLPVRRGGAENEWAAPMMTTFWTACPYCYGLFEYPKIYQECCLRCDNCKKAFHAAKIHQLPPIVPGRDEYYCCWGFFPMGYVEERGGKDTMRFPNWMPPIFPTEPSQPQPQSQPQPPLQPQTPAFSGRRGIVGGATGGRAPTAPAGRGGVVGVQDGSVPKKRGRGRPRKYPLPT